MTLTVAEIIIEVRREAERKHGVPDEMAQNWPRFSLVKVVPLCDEIERLTAERDALAGQLAEAQGKLAVVPVYVRGVIGAAPLVSFDGWYAILRGDAQTQAATQVNSKGRMAIQWSQKLGKDELMRLYQEYYKAVESNGDAPETFANWYNGAR